MIKDYQLYIVVFVLLSIDIAIMTTWQIVDPFRRETKLMQAYVSIFEVNTVNKWEVMSEYNHVQMRLP